MPFREGQPKFAAGTIHRNKISAPVELISTTNLIAYTAPDLPGQKGVAVRPSPKKSTSSSSSFRSADESDATNSTRAPSTSVTSPDLSSNDASPVTTELNGPSSYFNNSNSISSSKRSNTIASSHRSRSSAASSTTNNDVPALPQRSLSHTKKSHQELVRQRSKSKMTPPPTSLSHTHSVRMTQDQYNNEPAPHPFGKELEQVNEVAEEFGGGQMIADEEEKVFREKGLLKFSVEDYILEVEQIYQHIFPDALQKPLKEAWI